MVNFPLLVVNDRGAGDTTRANLARANGQPLWGGSLQAAPFGRRAYEAVQAAHRAVGSFCAMQLPPVALEEHAVSIGRLRDYGIEGGSLGLSFALGFAALWTGHQESMPPATGALTCGADGWQVKPVGGIAAKTEVAHQRLRTNEIFLHPDNCSEIPPGCRPWVTGVEVRTVRDALQKAGISLDVLAGLRLTMGLPQARTTLNAEIEAVRTQTTMRTRWVPTLAGPSPWTVAADRLCALADVVLELGRGRGDAALAVKARTWAALAYGYGGGSDRSNLLLSAQMDGLVGALDPSEQPAQRVLVDVIRLTHAIDRDDWTNGQTLTQRLDNTYENASGDIRARALGTIGRFHVHRRDTRDPIKGAEYIRRSITEWEAFDPGELGRSWLYLAVALRVAGQIDASQAALEASREHLDELAKTDPDYAESCRFWWRYDRARLFLRQDEPELARQQAVEALAISHNWGPAPQLGLTRVLARAEEALNNTAACNEWRQEARELYERSWRSQPLQRILYEALGEDVDPEEIY